MLESKESAINFGEDLARRKIDELMKERLSLLEKIQSPEIDEKEKQSLRDEMAKIDKRIIKGKELLRMGMEMREDDFPERKEAA